MFNNPRAAGKTLATVCLVLALTLFGAPSQTQAQSGAVSTGNDLTEADRARATGLMGKLLKLAKAKISGMHKASPGIKVDLSVGNFELFLFNSGEKTSPNWHAGLALKTPKNFAPQAIKDAIGDPVLNQVIIVISEGEAKIAKNKIPSDLYKELDPYLNNDGKLEVNKGINLLSSGNLGTKGAAGFVVDKLGFKGDAIISGTVGMDVISALLSGVETDSASNASNPTSSVAEDNGDAELFALEIGLTKFAAPPFKVDHVSQNFLPNIYYNSSSLNISKQGDAYEIGGAQEMVFSISKQSMTINTKMEFSGDFDEDSFKVHVEGAVKSKDFTQISLREPFNKDWLKLNNIGVAFDITMDGVEKDADADKPEAKSRCPANLNEKQCAGLVVGAQNLDKHFKKTEENSKENSDQTNQDNAKLGFNVAFFAETQVGGPNGDTVLTKINVGVAENKIKDPSLQLIGTIQAKNLPLVDKIPGINEFGYGNIEMSSKMLAGEITWSNPRIKSGDNKIKGAGAILLDIDEPINTKFFMQMTGFSFGRILPGMPSIMAPLRDTVMPAGIMAIALNAEKEMNINKLPKRIQAMFANVSKSFPKKFQIHEGVTLAGALDLDNLPGTMKAPFDLLGINTGSLKGLGVEGPLVLAGSLGGIFSGDLAFQVYADLPKFTYPDNIRNLVGLKDTKSRFFMRMSAVQLSLQLGVSGNIGLSIPRIANPKVKDELDMVGDLFVNIDAVGVGARVAAYMDGTWGEPFGIGNVTITNPAFLIGVDPEGSVEVGFGGDVAFLAPAPKGFKGVGEGRISSKEKKKSTQRLSDLMALKDEEDDGKVNNKKALAYGMSGVVNINFSSGAPIPKKVGFVLKASEMGYLTQIQIADSLFRGVFAGPGATEITKTILGGIDQGAKKNAEAFLAKLRKGKSIIDVLHLNLLPLPLLEVNDVVLFFATPGAVVPGRNDLNTIGYRVAGGGAINFLGEKYQIGDIEHAITMSDGFILKGKLNPIKILGAPFVNKAKVDIQASLKKQHFHIDGDACLFGLCGAAALHLSKEGISALRQIKFDKLVDVTLKMQSVGKDLLKVTDMTTTASFNAMHLGEWLQKKVGNEIKAGHFALNQTFTKANAVLKKAQTEVKKLDAAVTAARKKALRNMKNLTAGLDKANLTLKKVKSDISKNEKKNCGKLDLVCIAERGIKVASLKLLLPGAKAAVNLLKKGSQVLPVDLYPDVALALAARGTAYVTLWSAEKTAEIGKKINDDVNSIGADLLSKAANTKGIILVTKAEMTTSVKAAVKNGSLAKTKLVVDITLPKTKTVTYTSVIDFNLKTGAANVGELVKAVINAVLKKPGNNVQTEIATLVKKNSQDLLHSASARQLILPMNNNKCIDVAGNKIKLAACDNKSKTQAWRSEINEQGFAQLVHNVDGKCLGVMSSSNDNSVAIGLQKCSTKEKQQWQVQNAAAVAPFVPGFVFRSRQTQKCITMTTNNMKQTTCARDNKNFSAAQSLLLKPMDISARDFVKATFEGLSGNMTVVQTMAQKAADKHMAYIGVDSKKCMDVRSARRSKGAPVVMWDCNLAASNQQFKLTADSELRAKHNNDLCLDATSKKKKGTKIHMWKCSGNSNQKWTITQKGQLKSKFSGLCLDVARSHKNNNAKIHQWTCNNKKNQQWKVVPPSASNKKSGSFDNSPAGMARNKKMIYRGLAAGRCLDVRNAANWDGAAVALWDCKLNARNQLFTLTKKNELRVDHEKNFCLDATSGKTKGTKIEMVGCTGKKSQRWTLTDKFQLKSQSSGLCLDVAGNKKKNGSKVHQWDCSKTAKNQKWNALPKGPQNPVTNSGSYNTKTRWQTVAGQGLDIAGSMDGIMYIVGNDNKVYWFLDNKSGSRGNLKVKRITVDYRNRLWAIATNNKVWRWQNKAWKQMPGTLKDIGSGGKHSIIGIGTNNKFYEWQEGGGGSWSGTPWTGSGHRVTIDKNSIPWMIKTNNEVYYLGKPENSPLPKWYKFPGKLVDITAGLKGDIYGLGTNHVVYKMDRSKKTWIKMGGKGNAIAIDKARRPWIITGKVIQYRR